MIVGDDPARLMAATLRDAAVVILGFEAPDEGAERQFFERMEAFAGALPRVLLVDSAGGMELDS